MKPLHTTILIGLGGLALGYWAGKASPTVAPAPKPGPTPFLPPIPNPNRPPVPPVTDPTALANYAAQVLAQANADPTSVDPNAMDQAAAECDQLGLTQIAAALRQGAATARQRQGTLPGPAPQPMPAPIPVPAAIPKI
jgi:hypothetical protein